MQDFVIKIASGIASAILLAIVFGLFSMRDRIAAHDFEFRLRDQVHTQQQIDLEQVKIRISNIEEELKRND